MKLEDLLHGRVEHYRGGTFFHIQRDLHDIDSGNIGKYIEEHKNVLLLKNIRKRFPDLVHIAKKRMLFLDIENCGLAYEDPIFLIGMLQISHDITLKSLLARDYSEESAILSYFLNQELPNYEVVFTFNGKTYDIPRINQRSIENGLLEEPDSEDLFAYASKQNHVSINTKSKSENPLQPFLNGEHHDILHLLRQRTKLPKQSRKLQTYEKILFNFRRRGDIPGKKIPQAYGDYVYGRADASILAQIVHHNQLDRISLAGFLTYLCS